MKFVVLRYGQLGDVVLLTSLFESIKNMGFSCYLATRKKYAGLFEEDPRIDGMFFLKDDCPSSLFNHAREIKKTSPDFIIDAHLKLRTFAVSLLTGTKTARYDSRKKQRRNFVNNKSKTFTPFFTYEAYAETLKKLGFAEKPAPKPRLHVTNESMEKAKTIAGSGKIAVIHAHSSQKSKHLDPKIISEASKKLSACGYRTVLIGPMDSFPVFADKDLRGMTDDLSVLKALLSISSVLITSDSGPLHVSEAVGTPVVAVFCSTSPVFGFRPWMPESALLTSGLKCCPCSLHGRNSCPRRDFACTKYYDSETIFNKARQIIENGDLSP